VAGQLRSALAANLRAERTRRGLTQEDFEPETHRTYVSGIECGRRNVTLAKVEQIAERLEIDPLDLLRSPPA
jgi:transcriptional regulator with XRE-family HTH domain